MLRKIWPQALIGGGVAFVLLLLLSLRGSGREQTLLRALVAPDSEVMMQAVQEVQSLPPNEREKIRRQVARWMLTHRDPQVRLRASFALVQLAHPDNVRAFRHALSDPDEKVRASAATALGNLHAREAFEELLPLLNDSSETVRRSAAYALGLLGRREALPELERHAEDAHEHPFVREAARKAMARLQGQPPPGADAEELWRPPSEHE